jgi:glycosyltransferase involved in cell wall biosynthesis
MRIGIDFRNVGKQRTGDEMVFFHLTRALLHLESDHEWLLFVDNRSPEEIETLMTRLALPPQNRVSCVNVTTSGKFHWNVIALPRALRAHPVDVYHTQYITPFRMPASTAVVTHIHDVSFRAYPEYISRMDRWFLDRLIPRSLREARAIIAVSEFTKQEIIKYYGEALAEKVQVIFNALGDDYAQYRGNDVDRERIRAHYHLPRKFLVAVGTLQPRKNIPQLIRAFALVAERLPETSLVLVGNRQAHHVDPDIERALTETGLSDRVIFPGYVDQGDLPGLISLAQAFVFPSRYEGFGIPLLEAMSQSVPTLAADIPSLREVGGEAALFVDTENLAGFGEALYTICMDQEARARLVEAGHERCQHFSWEQSARELVRVYESLR